MPTQLRTLYKKLSSLSTEEQTQECDALLSDGQRSPGPLATMFHGALAENASLDFRKERFLTDAARNNKQTTRTRVHDCLSSPCNNPIRIRLNAGEYSFNYRAREFTPLRHLDLGWVDYIGTTEISPLLGEVKVGSDQNPFYAFVQLLTYLSEMASQNQIARAVAHGELGIAVAFPQAFDLHILLVDHTAFKPRSDKYPLIKKTHHLSRQFKEDLARNHASSAAVVGKILCLGMRMATVEHDVPVSLECVWEA